MALPTPSLVDLDDPLQPARPAPKPPAEPAAAAAATETPGTPTTTRRRAAGRAASDTVPVAARRTLSEEELVAVFVRVPTSISDRLAATITALNAGRPRRARISQQDLVGALLDRYATTERARAAPELTALVDDYRQRVRG